MKAALYLLAVLSAGQFGSLEAPPRPARQYVLYVAEAQTVPSGKRATLDLHFRVENGYHVNSHAPKSDLQIPTAVELGSAPGVSIGTVEYPAGKSYTLSSDPAEKLDVYSEDFLVKLPVTAAPGDHELKGILKYQACDRAACYPPKTLPLDVVFTAK